MIAPDSDERPPVNEWRSEPPDSPGLWLYRKAKGAHPYAYDAFIGDACGVVLIGATGCRFYIDKGESGQWLKVPE